MRTIKRKRIFRRGNNQYKKSKKKLVGGKPTISQGGPSPPPPPPPPSPPPPPQKEIYKYEGIFGVYKETPICEITQDRIPDFDKPTQDKHNFFKASINNTHDTVVLTNYKPLYSIKLGWIFGAHFGNLIIYNQDKSKIDGLIDTINTQSANGLINETLFVSEINEKITHQVSQTEIAYIKENIYTPWDNKMCFEIEGGNELIAPNNNIINTFKNILYYYYIKNISGDSDKKIAALFKKINTLDDNDTLLKDYNKQLKVIYKNVPTPTKFDDLSNYTTQRFNVLWSKQVKGDDNVFNDINRYRQEQEVCYKEITELFSSDHIKDQYNYIPFNIEYFSYKITGVEKSNDFIRKYIDYFKKKLKSENLEIGSMNRKLCRSLSNILYNFKMINIYNDTIYRDSRIKRIKKIPDFEKASIPPIELNEFKYSTFLNGGYSSFYHNYIVNSLLHPIFMARLLFIHIHIKAIIILKTKTKANNITEVIELEDKKITGKNQIKKLTIDGKTLDEKTDDTNKVNFCKILSNKKKALKCDFEIDGEYFSIESEFDYIHKDSGSSDNNTTMIYMFNKKEVPDNIKTINTLKELLDISSTQFDFFDDSKNNENIKKSVDSLVGYISQNSGYNHHFYKLVF